MIDIIKKEQDDGLGIDYFIQTDDEELKTCYMCGVRLLGHFYYCRARGITFCPLCNDTDSCLSPKNSRLPFFHNAGKSEHCHIKIKGFINEQGTIQ